METDIGAAPVALENGSHATAMRPVARARSPTPRPTSMALGLEIFGLIRTPRRSGGDLRCSHVCERL